MKIAIFSDTFPPQINGVAHVASTSAKALKELGHEVEVFTTNDFISLPFFGYKGERMAIPVGRFYRRVKKFKPDIIHSHTPFGVGWGAVLCSYSLGIPLVGTHHTFFDHYLKHAKLDFSWIRWLSWKYVVAYYNRCDVVIGLSSALTGKMIFYGAKAEFVSLPNTIETSRFVPANITIKERAKAGLGLRGRVLLYMGRISYEKSIDQVIHAFSFLEPKYPDITLAIIGDGPQISKLKLLCDKLSLKRVIFTGALRGPELVSALQAGDIFVTASKTENMPISVLEAMAIGLPIVAVDSLGMPDIVKNNINGFLVHPDMPEEMAKKIGTLLDDRNLLEQYSVESRNLALKFSPEETIGKLESIYKTTIKNYKRGARS